jgi:hypothetical protein
VNGIRGHEPTDFTPEFAQRCHPDSQDVLGALRQRSHLGSRKSPTKKVPTTEHKDYVVNARQSKEARAIIPGATIDLTSSHSRDTPGLG